MAWFTVNLVLLVRLEAKPRKEADVESLLFDSLRLERDYTLFIMSDF
jgi:hypothetical protein